PRRAANEIRVRRQLEDCEGTRTHDPGRCGAACRRRGRMNCPWKRRIRRQGKAPKARRANRPAAYPEGKSVLLSNFERYQRIAWVYDLLDLPFEYGRYRKIRPLLFRGLSGRILDAGVGTGRNFPFYPPGSEVVGIDLSPAMLARAERRRPTAAARVELRQMDVTRLGFPDRSFDAAIAT